MSDEQDKKTNQVSSAATVKDGLVTSTKPAGDLSDEDLDKVAGGYQVTPLPQWETKLEKVELVDPQLTTLKTKI